MILMLKSNTKEHENKKCVIIVSGGIDSTTLLYYIKNAGYEPHALSFNYGQRHLKELDLAKYICSNIFVPHILVDITSIHDLIAKGSLMTKDEVPEGHYQQENMKSTVVPNRNMIMLSIAVGYAATIGASKVFYAAHHGDHDIYPDCRKDFVRALDHAVFLGNKWENDNQSIHVEAPFIDMTKTDIVRLGFELRVPYEKTWSCYKGGELACGKCGTCVERLESFANNDVIDPISYEDDNEGDEFKWK